MNAGSMAINTRSHPRQKYVPYLKHNGDATINNMAQSSSNILYDIFNAKLKEFASEMSRAFPAVDDLATLNNALELAIAFTPSKPCELFHAHVVEPYEQQILAQDEAFFIQGDPRERTSAYLPFDIVERIRALWSRMTSDDKETVWQYLQVLILLDRKRVQAEQ